MLGAYSRVASAALFCVCVAGSADSAEQNLAKLFGARPGFGASSLSPDGKYVALIAPIDGVDNVVMAPLDATGKPSRFTVPDSSAVDVYWHDSRQLLAKIRTVEGRGFGQEYFNAPSFYHVVLSPTGEKPPIFLKTEDAYLAGSVTAIIDLNSSDPNIIYASSLRITANRAFGTRWAPYYRRALLRVNLRNGRAETVHQGELNTAKWVMDGVGHIIARIDVDGRQKIDIFVPEGKDFRKLVTFNTNDVQVMGLTEDAASLAVAVTHDNRIGLDRIALTDGKFGEPLFRNPSADLDSVMLDDRPGRVVRIRSVSDDHSRALVVSSGVQNPPTLHVVDLKANRIDVLAEAYPQLSGKLGAGRRVTYKTSDGVELTGLLTLPPRGEAKNLPLVALGSIGFGYSDGNFDWFAQYLAQRGYAVFQSGSREAKGLGDVSSMDELGSWMNASQDDIADSKRICIVGTDSGGYMALSAPIFRPDQYACAISFAGMSDIKLVVHNARSDAAFAGNLFNSALIRNSQDYSDEALDRFSPARHADAYHAPILMLVPATYEMTMQANIMKDAMTAAKKPFELVTLKNDEGNLSKGESREALLNAVDKFLAAHIGK